MQTDNLSGWKDGFGVIRHNADTIVHMDGWLHANNLTGALKSTAEVVELLSSADKLANAAMWIIARMTYAKRVDLSGAREGER